MKPNPKHLLLSSGGISAIILCLIVSYVLINSQDTELADDTHLIPAPDNQLAEEDNALEFLLKAAEAMEQAQVKEQTNEESKFNPSAVKQLLDANTMALSHIAQAASKKGVYEVSDYSTTAKSSMISIIKPCELIKTRAMLSAHEGKWQQYLSNIQLLEKFSSDLISRNTSLIDFLVAVALYSKQMDAIEFALNQRSLPLEMETSILVLLGNLDRKTLQSALKRSFKGEYMYMLDIMKVSNPSSASNYFIHPNRTQNIVITIIENLISFTDLPPHLVHKQISPKQTLHPEVESFMELPTWRRIITPNTKGYSILSMTSPIIARQIPRAYQTLVARDLLCLTIYLRRYERIHGQLPDSVNQLNDDAQHYLCDHYATAPEMHYRYDKPKRKLWSIGNDLIDNQGVGVEEGRSSPLADHDEPTIIIPAH